MRPHRSPRLGTHRKAAEGAAADTEEVATMSKHVKNREERRAELDETMERLDRGVREVSESGR